MEERNATVGLGMTAVSILVAAAVSGLLFAGLGYLAALVNTLAVIGGRGQYFAAADTAGARFR